MRLLRSCLDFCNFVMSQRINLSPQPNYPTTNGNFYCNSSRERWNYTEMVSSQMLMLSSALFCLFRNFPRPPISTHPSIHPSTKLILLLFLNRAVGTKQAEVVGSRPWISSQQVVRLLHLWRATPGSHRSLAKVPLLLPSAAAKTRAELDEPLENWLWEAPGRRLKRQVLAEQRLLWVISSGNNGLLCGRFYCVMMHMMA